MAEEQGFLSEQQAGAELGKMFAEETPPTEVREVKFKARVRSKKAAPKAEVDDADKEIVPLTPADGSPDPDRELDDDANPYKDEKKRQEPEPAEEPDGEPDGGGEGEEAPKPRLIKVKEDGIEVEKPEDEVAKGYMRTADYTRKTQALAEERKRFVAEEVEPTRAARQAYWERLQALDAVIPHPGKEPDWEDLRNRLTPEEFTQQFGEWKVLSGRYARIQQERERVLREQEEDATRAMQSYLAAERKKLQAVFPDWGTEKGQALKDDLIAYAKSLTFTDEDLAGVTDHRLLVLLDKARRYDEAQKRKPKIEDKIDRALDALRPSTTKSRPRLSDTQRLEAQLAKTGRVEDAAQLISKLL